MISDDAKWHWAEGTKFVLEGAKSMLLVNGAASISIITFLGNEKLNGAYYLILAMCLFAMGAFSSVLIFFASYVTQLHYGNENQMRAISWHWTAYFTALFGILMFVFEIGFAAYGFSNLPRP